MTRRHANIDIDRQQARPLFVVDGWAARWRLAGNGSRQLINLILPGDVVYPIDHGAPPMIALTELRTCVAPDVADAPGLQEACEGSRQLDQAYLFSQIGRLGSMRAEERLIDLIAEIYERLVVAGQAANRRFEMPLAQAILAELLALTPVHTNRMVNSVRRQQKQMHWIGRTIIIQQDSEIERRARRNLATIAHRRPGLHRV